MSRSEPTPEEIRKWNLYTGHHRYPRLINRYPPRQWFGVRRQGRQGYKYERQPRPRRHARSWRYVTRIDRDATLLARATTAVRGSLQERIFYQALTDRGFTEGQDFGFQIPELGGRMILGGLLPDFVLFIPKIVIQVQSAWHTMSQFHRVRDDETTVILERLGYQVLEIWPEDIEDETRLDEWLDRNLSQLWGTNHSSSISVPGAPVFNELEVYGVPIARDIQAMLDKLVRVVLG